MQVKHTVLEQLVIDGTGPSLVTESDRGDLVGRPDRPPGDPLRHRTPRVSGHWNGGRLCPGDRPIVQLHSVVGLGNAMAMLYQTVRRGTPLVVIAGEDPARFADLHSFLAADLVRLAVKDTKCATRPVAPEEMLRVLWRVCYGGGKYIERPTFRLYADGRIGRGDVCRSHAHQLADNSCSSRAGTGGSARSGAAGRARAPCYASSLSISLGSVGPKAQQLIPTHSGYA